MKERELLELAAKASGLLPLPAGKELDYTESGGLAFCGDGDYFRWNPLDDDGDALRLAVKLGMTVDVMPHHDRRKARTVASRGGGFQEFHLADPYAATRRAIVRAAAEIGKAMK